jgi:hypothetical protein
MLDLQFIRLNLELMNDLLILIGFSFIEIFTFHLYNFYKLR